MIRRAFIVTLLALIASGASAQTTTLGTTSGDFTVEPPTLVSLGFEWKIAGDDNRNASVDVSYRKKGEVNWKKGLPLLRLQREWVNGGPPLPTVQRYKTFKEYSDASGQDRHSVLVDYDTFMNVTMPDKTDPQRLYKPDGLDFRLKPGSAAIDAGIELPSITDGFTGKAPDIGAYESGPALPHYGPR